MSLRATTRALLALAALSVIALIAAESYRHARRRYDRPGVPIGALDADEPSVAEATAVTADSDEPDGQPWQLSELYHGNARVAGLVRLRDGAPVAGAEVIGLPWGFGPSYPEEFRALTAHTDVTGFFSLPGQPEAIRYAVVAFTRSHYGVLEAACADATSGRMVVTATPVLYTKHEFVDSLGQPVRELSANVRELIRGTALASTHAGWPEDSTVNWILRRMDVRLPEEPNIVVTVFTESLGPVRPSSVTIDLPGFAPVAVAMTPRSLSEWPQGETVRLTRDSDDTCVFYTIEVPPPVAWPREWGVRDPRLDFRIWYAPEGTDIWASVNRRTPSFALSQGVSVVLRDQNRRALTYVLAGGGIRRIVRPAYPAYGILRLTYPPILDPSKSYGVTLRASGEGDAQDIAGVAALPGVIYFGPLAVGEYDARLQWFVAGSTSAFVPVRDLGKVTVREGANDHRCE